MTTYVLVGHGGFSPSGGGYPPEVLLPPNTTVRFFSEAGQALAVPAVGSDADFVGQIAPAWKQLKDRTEASPAQGVVYNLSLSPLDSPEEMDAAADADWNGANTVQVNQEAWLCEGTADTCPTPQLNVRKQTETIPDDRWHHHCEGILGVYGGKGNEIHWIACTSFDVVRHDLPPLITADEAGPGQTIAPDWIPDNDAMREIIGRNRQNIKAVEDGGEAGVAVGGALVIIGAEHSAEAASYIKRQNDMEEGILTVTKGGAFSKGGMEVKGISPAKQELVRLSIEEFSKKKVTFV
jgi:hypothetical protein